MSKLPPLPVELAAFANTGILHAALDDIVSEYGQQCHDAAFDEAAEHMRQWDFEGLAVEIEGLKK